MAPVTSIYASLLAIMLIVLGLRVVQVRIGRGIPLGTGSSDDMEQRIRVHGNLAEWGPIFIVLLLLAELGRAPAFLLHGCGMAFLVARLMHAVGLTRVRGRSAGRFYGSVISWTTILVLAIYLLATALR